MKIRKDYVILVGVIAMLALYLALHKGDRSHYTLPAIPALAAKDITRIQITRDAQPLELTRDGERWLIGPAGAPADPKQVQEMLESIAGITLTALVSESRNYTLYELDETHRISVKSWQGDQLLRAFDVGKVAPSFRHTFVKLDGDDRVFHAQDAIKHRFNLSADDLRDKTVLTFNPSDIREIELTQSENRTSLTAIAEKTEGAAGEAPAKPEIRWQGPDGRSADSPAVEALLKLLSHLNCENFISDRPSSDFKSPVYSIVLKGSTEHRLSIFAPLTPEDKDQPAVSSAVSQPFILAGFQVKQIIKAPEEFFRSGSGTP
jgi:hypothetical protein